MRLSEQNLLRGGIALWPTSFCQLTHRCLYLVGNLEDPVVVWKKLADQLEKKTWATRLDLRRKLHLLRLKDGQETAPTGSEAERTKFAARRDRALATVVLSVDTSLLYLVGNPEDPVVFWKKLADQFEKKTWATRLHLHRKLHSLRLKDGNSAQEHIKVMTELFDTLSRWRNYFRRVLPESYSVLVTALEANEDVPKLEVVTEHIYTRRESQGIKVRMVRPLKVQ